MAHHHLAPSYKRLAERLNKFPQGAPATTLLFDILKMLFSEQEAGLVAQLPIRPFTAETAAKTWKMDLAAARNILDTLASRAILVDIDQHGTQMYCLPPPMAGFFEFSMMRVRNDIDQKALSELYYQYINVEEDFIRALVPPGQTPLGRIFVQEPALPDPAHLTLEVLDYERATHVVETASHIGISMCYCRHKMQHMGKACDAPMDICMTFNTSARSLIKYGHARSVDKAECLDLLSQAYEHNLVQFGENARENVNFICNCCGCCCEALLAVKRFGLAQTIHSNFVAGLAASVCVGCGKCVGKCPVQAIEMKSDDRENKKAVLDESRCIGCGVCVRSCPVNALMLKSRPERAITPMNTVHRVVVMATERGTLQHMIFDNHVLDSYRLLAAVLGAILKLPGLSRVLAAKQLRSRYLEKLIARMDEK